MQFRLASIVVLATVGGVFAAARTSTPVAADLVVHEWGTFTSIAGPEGSAVEWLPQGGRSDLPCFVERSLAWKGSLTGTVRMETPVLYFYSPNDVTVDVDVAFKGGAITEWYPHGTMRWRNPDGGIAWSNVRISRTIDPQFAVEGGHSHYYEARHTDAVPLQAGSQREKFLFYRGVGRFAPPVSATADADGRTTVWTQSHLALGDVIVFDNHNGTIAFSKQNATTERATLDPPAVDDDATAVKSELERILIGQGLYPKEAQAMVATWSDSWFEEGSRLFYIAPREMVDAVLPLTVSPAPSAVTRVFVGRLELVTAATRDAVRRALLETDHAALATYGRFLRPIGQRVVAAETSERLRLDAALQAAAPPDPQPWPSCR